MFACGIVLLMHEAQAGDTIRDRTTEVGFRQDHGHAEAIVIIARHRRKPAGLLNRPADLVPISVADPLHLGVVIVIEAEDVKPGRMSLKPAHVRVAEPVLAQVRRERMVRIDPAKNKIVDQEAAVVGEVGTARGVAIETAMRFAGIDVNGAETAAS